MEVDVLQRLEQRWVAAVEQVGRPLFEIFGDVSRRQWLLQHKELKKNDNQKNGQKVAQASQHRAQ